MALFGKLEKGGISEPELKMDVNVIIGLTFTQIEWRNEQKYILFVIQCKFVFVTCFVGLVKPYCLRKKITEKISICGFVIQKDLIYLDSLGLAHYLK